MGEDRLKQMEAAIEADEGATAPPTPGPGDSGTTEQTDPALDSASPAAPAAEEQPEAKKGWGDLLSKYKPEDVRKRIEEAENAKAMRREAHQRNEQAARDRAEADALKREAREALERNRALVDTAAALADENPDLAAQMLAMFKRQSGITPNRAGNGVNDVPDGRVAQLENQITELRKQTTQMAFGLNHSAVTAAALEAASREPLLRSERMQKRGLPDKVIQKAIEAVYEQDRANPGEINPYDPRSLRNAVDLAVKAEATYYAQLISDGIDDYREGKRGDAKRAPPSGKGPAANVRVAPTQASDKPRGNDRQRRAWYERQFLKATPDSNESEVT